MLMPAGAEAVPMPTEKRSTAGGFKTDRERVVVTIRWSLVKMFNRLIVGIPFAGVAFVV
jgi:hypothetical protein